MTVFRHVSVSGRVQGVGYRAWVMDEARRNGLSGWVRNRRDGSVEAVFVGEEEDVAAMVAACRRGPGTARVDRVSETEASPALVNLGDMGFVTLPTL